MVGVENGRGVAVGGWWWKREKGSGVDWSRGRRGRNSRNREGGGEVMGQHMGFVLLLSGQKG